MHSGNAAPGLVEFAAVVADWQKRAGRRHLPWQNTTDPYRIWLSEIMLQQTQVSTAAAYYERFLQRFPCLQTLARATQDEVMPYWAGLGYYARARNLHRCAQVIAEQWSGKFPPSAHELMQLPGIGRSTAAAIAAFAYGERAPIMDGNVKRVFARYFGIYGDTARRAVEQQLWRTAENVLLAAPAALDMAAYTQGLMDLGSGCCSRTSPDCGNCPLSPRCFARLESRQHELPAPRPKKISPERHCKMLIVQIDDHVLLEQQPQPGIWGGLLSLPKYDDMDTLNNACIRLGQQPAKAAQMAGLLHTFSHFRLHIEPWLLTCSASSVAEPGPQQIWMPIGGLAAAALPAPIKKLLTRLFDN